MAKRFIALHYNRKIAGAASDLRAAKLASMRARYTRGEALRRRRKPIHFQAEAM